MANSIDTVTALQLRGAAVQPLLASELDLARVFGWSGSLRLPTGHARQPPAGGPAAELQFQWLGEGALRAALLAHIAAAEAGDGIDIATDSLSERSLVAALLAASRRGVGVR